MQEQVDKAVSKTKEYANGNQGQEQIDDQLKTEGVADAVVVVRTEKLGNVDTCAGACALRRSEGNVSDSGETQIPYTGISGCPLDWNFAQQREDGNFC